MNDELIFCPKCGSYENFVRTDKYVRIYEFSKGDKTKIQVICCNKCGYPIGVYPDNNDD